MFPIVEGHVNALLVDGTTAYEEGSSRESGRRRVRSR